MTQSNSMSKVSRDRMFPTVEMIASKSLIESGLWSNSFIDFMLGNVTREEIIDRCEWHSQIIICDTEFKNPFATSIVRREKSG
ncbi:hypothetical protein ACHAXS_005095, partial [Conticribra weissflogii]